METSPGIHDQDNFCSSTGSSSFHFNSFFGLVTSDDDDDEDDDTDQDTYIEIALELPQVPWPPSPPQPQDQEDRPLINDQEDELQLRISFSSRVLPFPGFSSVPSALCSGAVRAYATTGSDSCPDDQAIGSEHSSIQGASKIRFGAALNRLIRFFPSTSTLNMSTRPVCSWELDGSREVNMTAAARRSGVGNFLVKLRATTFQMMMASLLKLRQFTSSRPEKMNRRDIQQLKPRNRQMLVLKPFNKLFRRMQNTQSKSCIISKIGGNIQRSRVIDVINLKGSEEADRAYGHGGVSMKTAISTSSKGREKKTKSCPASVKSSPTKEQFSYELGGGSSGSQKTYCGRENSVQAAIAHCKKSLVQADDFLF